MGSSVSQNGQSLEIPHWPLFEHPLKIMSLFVICRLDLLLNLIIFYHIFRVVSFRKPHNFLLPLRISLRVVIVISGHFQGYVAKSCPTHKSILFSQWTIFCRFCQSSRACPKLLNLPWRLAGSNRQYLLLTGFICRLCPSNVTLDS